MTGTKTAEKPALEIDASRGFPSWLADFGASLAFTTYQVGKLLFIGVKPDGSLWVHNRNFGRCLGMAADGDALWVSSDVQIYRLNDAMAGNAAPAGVEGDAFYIPQMSYFTGDLDVHDLIAADGKPPVFVNTLFNCLATVSETASFKPLWRPPFITEMKAEDRCHLNGVAMEDGAPRYVTAISESDTFDGWRDHRRDGGVVIDVKTGEVIARGLSMPHSPRLHEGRIWLCNSGQGELGFVDPDTGRFEAVAFCPGYMRGLSIHNGVAAIGLSLPRENKTFSGLPLQGELERRKVEPRCGVYFIELATGTVLHSVTIRGVISELYDVLFLPGRLQPGALGPGNEALKRTVSIAGG